MEAPKEPDEYTNAWYRKQFQGFTHQQRSLSAEYVAQFERAERLEKRIVALEAEREKDKAVIGELNDRIERLIERVRVRLENGGGK